MYHGVHVAGGGPALGKALQLDPRNLQNGGWLPRTNIYMCERCRPQAPLLCGRFALWAVVAKSVVSRYDLTFASGGGRCP